MPFEVIYSEVMLLEIQ